MPDDGTQTRRSAHKRLYEARERTAYLEVLSRMQSAIANEYSLDDTLAAVTESAVSLLDADGAVVLLIAPNEPALVPKAAAGVLVERSLADAFRTDQPVSAEILRTGKPVIVEDASERPDVTFPLLGNSEAPLAAAAMPICLKEKPHGILYVFSADPRPFSEADMAGLSVLADSCAVAVVRARTYEDAVRERTGLETALEVIPSATLIIEKPDGRISLANRKLCEFLGLEVKIGTPFSTLREQVRFINPDGSEIPRGRTPVMRAMLDGEIVEGEETEIIRPDGQRVTALANAAPLIDQNGVIYGAVAEYEDVTAMKDAQVLLRNALDKQRRISTTLQTALLPTIPERMEWLTMAGDYMPAYVEDYVGGDFYDAFSPAPGYVAIVIGDVSGKGIGGAIRTALTKYSLRSYAYEDPGAASVIGRTNAMVSRECGIEFFVTLFYGLIDLKTATMSFVNAGHEPPLLIRSSEARIIELTQGGTPLGIIPDRAYGESSLVLHDGDKLVLYTDGVTEARGEEGFLGVEGLEKFVLENLELSPSALTTRLVDLVLGFSKGRLRDDVAVLIVQAD